jgi:hypothetical protein
MGKVETLLEKLMEKVTQVNEGPRDLHDSAGGLPLSSRPETSYLSQTQGGSSFNTATQNKANANGYITSPQSISAMSSIAVSINGEERRVGGLEKLQRRLAAMLPCQEDVDQLMEMSRGWWLIQRHMLPDIGILGELESRNPFEVSAVSRGHPIIIARLLLCVALCIQQLPPEIDPRRFETKKPLREMIEEIFTFVTSAVISDDELVGRREGVECVVLQGLYHTNAGNLRKAWLVFRRAINIAQLLGFHRVSFKIHEEIPDLKERLHNRMWFEIMRGV